MSEAHREDPASPPESAKRMPEWLGIAVLIGAVVFVLKVSWRKWPDMLIDFGRELYLPWRLGEGAVLYRDVAAIYGPLSQYFNALVFRLLGPGLMHLVWVNLLIYCAILVLVYHTVRTGWGRLAAFASTLFFIIAFSFSQYVEVGNYNFATPYAHETTHGFLLILVLVVAGASWLRRPAPGRALALGVAAGLCALLKVEIALAAGAVVLGLLVRAKLAGILPRWDSASAFLGGVVAPPVLATLWLHQAGGFTWFEAALRVNGGWLGPLVYRDIAGGQFQAATLGLSHPWENLVSIVLTGGVSLAAAWGFAWLSARGPGRILVASAMIIAILISFRISWLHIGMILPVWLACAALLVGRDFRVRNFSKAADMRWLLLCAAMVLLARMVLHPRIFHYGYYQAALAGIVVVATAFRTLPATLNLAGKSFAAYSLVLAAFLAIGLGRLHAASRSVFALKRSPIGEGVDLFYGFASSGVFEDTRRFLAATPDYGTLLVVPEGVTLNYLLRKPAPIAPYVFNPDWLRQWGAHVDRIPAHPPDYVVLISRDLREYGVQRFGESSAHGKELLSWVMQNYEPVEQFGFDPLDPNLNGALVLRRSR